MGNIGISSEALWEACTENFNPHKATLLCKITEARTTWFIQRAEQKPARLEPNE